MTDTKDEIRIERAGPPDLDRLLPLFTAYLEFYKRPRDEPRARTFLAERLVKQDSTIFLAEDGRHRAVGFVQLYPTFASLAMAPWWILYDLYVVRELRRRGVGKMLLDRARALAAETGAAGLSLETARDNPAQKLYEALGWQRDDVFLHYELVV